ncbi:DsbA family oxidoreductase [Flavisolibacter ginsengisoli]|jgi:predicted DsbA family dithiol-disulfide isomerase|uniref:Predicted dithiol-disulfide isomerase, DsbA family n=1 Tax=Flavisolibacter ginsengisoli DSM 18119 TaxID=1121884 RepID=A0A1M5G6T7_9BACT|nr:DsbA family oxidoreductase [Flavisolibacter ginsengisoli]SHF99443.1 Predicted dithiol-disulfide isomerase, DsbA family [Flavisolibacter ginsengisoli DSM 18119]
MKVEIWSDIVCPFCYIGKRKFEKSLEGFEAREQVEIVWRSFQLDPDMEYVPGQSVHEYLGSRKGVSAKEGKQMNDSMAAMAREVGLEYNFDKAVINNTMDAHRLLHLAKTKGLQNEMKERLFKAYYTEGKNTGDLETLVALGAEVGLDAEEVRNVLQTDAYRQQVNLDQYEAQQVGARGVPFFVFNNKYAVSGAQPTNVFTQVLERVWEEEKPALVTGDEATAGFCTPDGICN